MLQAGIQGQMHSPFFRMDSRANWYMSYGWIHNQMAVNFNGKQTQIDQAYNRFVNTTIAFDSSNQWYAGAASMARAGILLTNSSAYCFYFQSPRTGAWADGNHTVSNVNFKRRLELVYNSGTTIYDPDRVQIPRIAVTGGGISTDPAKIFMSYYDGNHSQNPVVFRQGEFFDGTTDANTNGKLSGSLSHEVTSVNEAGCSAAGRQIVAISNGPNATQYRGSIYTAVGATSAGRALVAWHCPRTRSLVFSYSDTPAAAPSAEITAGWQNRITVVDNDFAGWHVDMAVDSDDNVHLAYYTSGNGGLRYALGKFNAANQRYVFEVVRVDTFLSAGTRIMINVREERRTVNGIADQLVQTPYISYFHATFPQTSNSVRIAWRNNFDTVTEAKYPGLKGLPHGTFANDSFTGIWEVMTVPTNNIPQDGFICNGVPSAGSLVNTFDNLLTNQTVLLGYHTDQHYERAILKGSTITP